MNEDWRNAVGILMCTQICDGAGTGICDGAPSTCSSFLTNYQFVCVEVLRPSQPNGVMSSAVSLPNHTFTGQA